MFVDAGNLFTDDRFSAGQLPSEVMTKNKWVVKSYGDFRHTAANLAHRDLPYASELFLNEGFEKRVEQYPFINKLVSANLEPLDDKHRAPAPYVIREITLTRSIPGTKLRVAFVGFTDLKPGPGMNEKSPNVGAFKILDPFEAAKRVLPELKDQADVIVALAYMSQPMAQRLASENPEIDTIVGAQAQSATEEPQHFNRATITYAYHQTKYVGELRYYLKADGSIDNQANRYVAMDSIIPDDPKALQLVNRAHDEFTAEQNRNAKLETPPAPGIMGNSPFVTAESCKNCHEEEYRIWQASGHAHAMATLEKKNQQFDNECVGCHVVGFNEGGFKSLVTTPHYANVQCESCHGPGQAHIGNPGKGYGFMATPVGCVKCHTQPNSPDFNFEAYWAMVKH
jgi:hypothetical protein